MKHETSKTLRFGCLLLIFFFVFSSFAILLQPVQAEPVAGTMTFGSLNLPWQIAVTPDGKYVFAALEYTEDVAVVNTATYAQTNVNVTLTAGYFVSRVAAANDYAVATWQDAVTVISTSPSIQVLKTINLPSGSTPAGVAIASNSTGTYAYVADSGSNTISVINLATPYTIETISLPTTSSPVSVVATPNGDYIYVTASDSSLGYYYAVYVINTSFQTVTEVDSHTYPPSIFGGVAASNNYAYLADFGAPGEVLVINSAATVVTELGVASYPTDVAVSPDRACAFVTNGASDSVSAIDTSTNTVVQPLSLISLPAGSYPNSVAIGENSTGEYAYVANLGPSQFSVHTISVIAVPLSLSTSPTTTISSGSASLTTANGVSVMISGSTAPDGTDVSVTSTNYGAQNPGVVPVSLSNGDYYDVQVTGITDGTATISITSPDVTSSTVMQYWSGTAWVTVAPPPPVSGHTITGSIPVADLQGTPIALGSPTTYPVIFTESGLPSGTSWSVTFNTATISSTTSQITFNNIQAGEYSWTLTTPISKDIGVQYAGTPASGSMNVPAVTSQSITFQKQYYLLINANLGTTTPTSGWVNSGTKLTITATPPANTYPTGERYQFQGWLGIGSGSYLGTNNPTTLTMNSPIVELAVWTHQYQLTVKTNGLPSPYSTKIYLGYGGSAGTASGFSPFTTWKTAGASTGTIGVDSPINGASGTRYVFAGWQGDGTSNPHSPETMSQPVTLTANYKPNTK